MFSSARVLVDSFCRTESNRYSLASNSDTFHPPSAAYDTSTVESAAFSPRQRHDSNTLLMLPAPLAVNRAPMSSASSVGMSRSSEDNLYSDTGNSGSNLRLVPSPQSVDQYSDSYESSNNTSTGINTKRYTTPPPPPPESRYESPVPRQAMQGMNNRSNTSSVEGSSANPFYTQTTSPISYDDHYSPVESDRNAGRGGVRLTDSGPVPGPEGVRRVARPVGRRPSSQAPQNRYSRNSTVFSLPPGAAAPQHNYGNN